MAGVSQLDREGAPHPVARIVTMGFPMPWSCMSVDDSVSSVMGIEPFSKTTAGRRWQTGQGERRESGRNALQSNGTHRHSLLWHVMAHESEVLKEQDVHDKRRNERQKDRTRYDWGERERSSASEVHEREKDCFMSGCRRRASLLLTCSQFLPLFSSLFYLPLQPASRAGRPKIDRSMISGPSNFVHTGHMGNSDTGQVHTCNLL